MTQTFLQDRGPSVDDQPGFKNRDISGEGTSIYNNTTTVPDNEEDVIKKWKKKKKKRNKKTTNTTKNTIPRNSI